ncbi:MAG TPA: hypothetical protein PK563_11845 [Tenuifilaceae bacterium]|nr:hypothetical protein [Tenuifilaceae bacterium]
MNTNSKISVGNKDSCLDGPLLEIRKQVKYLDSFFITDDSIIPMDKFIIESKYSYTISSLFDEIYTAINNCERAIIFLNLIQNRKYYRYFEINQHSSNTDEYLDRLRFIYIEVYSHNIRGLLDKIVYLIEALNSYIKKECSGSIMNKSKMDEGKYLIIGNVFIEINNRIKTVKDSFEINLNCNVDNKALINNVLRDIGY